MLDAFGYQQTIARLDKAGVLYAVLGDFADIELHPDVVSNEAMGYIFEELLRKFSEMSNETAGEHYTPREVIQLMVDLLLDEDADALTGQSPVRTVYDPAAGTGGMLTVATNYLERVCQFVGGGRVMIGTLRSGVIGDGSWAVIEPVLPSGAGRRGRPWNDHRKTLEAIAWRFRTGCPWRDLPAQFGAWSVWNGTSAGRWMGRTRRCSTRPRRHGRR